MKRVLIFGKPGGGKSTLGKQISSVTGIPLYSLDAIEYQSDGQRTASEDYEQQHDQLINRDRWIIDGLGSLASFWKRIDAADTLVLVDLPYPIHYWWATKRLLKSPFVKPDGWPEGSSVLAGTIASWHYLRLSPGFWTPELLAKIKLRANDKTFYRLTSVQEVEGFAQTL